MEMMRVEREKMVMLCSDPAEGKKRGLVPEDQSVSRGPPAQIVTG